MIGRNKRAMRSTVEAAASATLSERANAIRFGTNSPKLK